MQKKDSLSEYTEAEFIELIQAIGSCKTEQERDELLDRWDQLVPHPAGTDLLYYPEPGADDSPEGITQTVKEWRAANGLPGFKDVHRGK
ncbi:bacteriocin immunity protein [Pseudomonas chlororaphis]|uniref:bacteriocin immunity protein n=1 Tax=Pseudomonas chlororaphis TaxID=587753 RepID=UPI0003D2CAA6|nr:bacteriocin immunity protein [Pseudomonas chlororaphis]AZD31607.1 colicin immunity protein [Pseudomonas chlororaphis]ETD40453.1 colicin immunity protein ImmE2 [Pseudomonas chlororaphis subsp. aurantiaca PB-St2]QFS56922.1 bacteriocin immunity protein [Pseudomonas chlororaphis subsp. aurantiaca]